jgi:hypothetical protein
LRGGQILAEEQAGGFGQLMRLIEYHRVAGRQQFRHAFISQHHVGEEQMVIDHHDICLHRLRTRMEHEAFLVVRAFLAQTVVARRGDLQPDRRVLRHIGHAALVAGTADLGVLFYFSQMFDVFASSETAIGKGPFQMIVAHVIGAALEQGDGNGRLECIAHHRQILLEQLVLQIFGAGGDDHLAAAQQGRHQVGEGLAGAGARFRDQNRVIVNRICDRQRHFPLLCARTE